MKKVATISFIVGFVVGAFTYALFTYQQIGAAPDVKQIVSLLTGVEEDKTSLENRNHTYVTYDGSSFRPLRVIMPVAGYLYITNVSKTKQMYLNSEHPYLRTPRAYGESEQIKVRLDTEGSFKVTDLLNPKATLEVIVRE